MRQLYKLVNAGNNAVQTEQKVLYHGDHVRIAEIDPFNRIFKVRDPYRGVIPFDPSQLGFTWVPVEGDTFILCPMGLFPHNAVGIGDDTRWENQDATVLLADPRTLRVQIKLRGGSVVSVIPSDLDCEWVAITAPKKQFRERHNFSTEVLLNGNLVITNQVGNAVALVTHASNLTRYEEARARIEKAFSEEDYPSQNEVTDAFTSDQLNVTVSFTNPVAAKAFYDFVWGLK